MVEFTIELDRLSGFSNEAKTVIDFTWEDGSLVILHPLKPQKYGRKVFQFNRVFGPTATQGNVTWDSSNLFLLHAYNVCIFAYCQTGPRKTHTVVRCIHDQI